MQSIRGQDGFIDVKKLIASYSFDEHMAQADAYFAGHGDDSALLRKPFQSPAEAAQIMQGLAIVLKELKLFAGARVVDFGAGTAWLSRIFAYLRCDVVATDLSRSALELGRRAIEKDLFAKDLKIAFLPYDGTRIPLPDADVDRICCFDSFHHVADQRQTLAEFYRVLKPGGIVALHEPGPTHSRTPEAQSEMANFKVIENDIVVEDIASIASAIGFADLKVAWYSPSPVLLDVGTFNKMVGSRGPRETERRVIDRAAADLQCMRIFFLYKPGVEVKDSRSEAGLKADLAVHVTGRSGQSLAGSISARNSGSNVWRPSDGELGAVWIGVHLLDADGRMIDNDYARIHVSAEPVAPGESRRVSFSLPVPDLDRFRLVFDPVAEQVAWFARMGSKEVTIESSQLPSA